MARVHRHRDAVRIEVHGVIDESLRPAELGRLATHDVLLDLSNVKRITSFGVKAWFQAIRAMAPHRVYFLRCSPAIVAQFGMIAGFGCGGQVLSIMAPYLCDACGEETSVLVDVRRDRALLHASTVGDMPCASCGAAAQFDDLPEQYFGFFRNLEGTALPPEIELLASVAGAAEGKLRIHKQIFRDFTAVRFFGTLRGKGVVRRALDGVEGPILLDFDGTLEVEDTAVGQFEAVLSGRDALKVAAWDVPTGLMAALQNLGVTIYSHRCETKCKTCGALALHVCRGDGRASPCPACDSPLPRTHAATLLEIPASVEAYLEPGGAQSGDSGDAFGRYHIAKSLGRGGMAEVFLARQVGPAGFERLVALKKVLPEYAKDPAFVDMFLSEAELAAPLVHPNLVQIIEFGLIGGEYFLAMEYVPGLDLFRLLRAADRAASPMGAALAAWVARGVCEALAAAHQYQDADGSPMPVVHRDVSPHNVLVTEHGYVKLTDFGIATVAGRTGESSFRGKVRYSAPERLTGQSNSDPRSDVFSAGVLLLECAGGLSGVRGRAARDGSLAPMAFPPRTIPLLRDLVPDAPRTLEEIILRAVAAKPEDRYQSAASMSAALASFLRTCAPAPTPVDLANWARAVVLHESGEGAGPASREDLEETARSVQLSGPPVALPPHATLQPSGESNAS